LPTKLARSATTDDVFSAKPSDQAALGWLDLQAFAPKALQKQLERLAEQARETIQSDDESEAPTTPRDLRGLAADAVGMLADRFGGAGGASSSSSARAPGGNSSSGLRAILQKRGGVHAGANGEEAVGSARQAEGQQEPELQPTRLTLTSVPEEEEFSPSSMAGALLSPRDLAKAVKRDLPISVRSVPEAEEEVQMLELQEAHIGDTDVSDSQRPISPPPAIPSATSSADPATVEPVENLDTSLPTAGSAASEPEAVPVESDAVEAQEESTESPPLTVASDANQEAEVEACQAAPAILASTGVDDAQSVAAPVEAAPTNPDVKDEVKEVRIDRRPSSENGVASKVKDPYRPPVAQWHGYVPTATKKWPPEPKASEADEEASKQAPKPEKFKDVHSFWKNHQVRFAGPPVGAKGISKVEAQAALQRLLSGGNAVDFDEVRRLRKLTAER
jgi:hypothetical protein